MLRCSNGVMQPFRLLGWWRWMYRLSPYTYLVEGLLGQAIGKREITCAPLELATVTPPSGQTCQQFFERYISDNGGYLTNPNATSDCGFCAFRTTDQFLLSSFNIEYSHHWRNFGIFIAYVLFNVSCISFSLPTECQTYWLFYRLPPLSHSLTSSVSMVRTSGYGLRHVSSAGSRQM